MLRNPDKRIVGVCLILGTALLLLLLVAKPDPFKASYTYWAVFNTAQGLGSIDRDVRVAGVKVGTVGEVERIGDDVKAELILGEDITIHQDARADMRPHTLFEGSNFVDLSPGSPSAPVLERGGTIPIEQTTNYVTLDEALRVLRPEIRNSLQDLAEVGSKTLRGKAIAGFQETLKNAPALTKALAPVARAAQGPNGDELAGAITGLSRTVDAVADEDAAVRPLNNRIRRTSGALAVDGGAALDSALAALPGALGELRDSSPALTAVVQRLDRLSVDITPALPDLQVALKDATPVLKDATPVLRHAEPLVKDARLTAELLGEAGEGGLTKMLKLLSQPLDELTDTLAVFNADSRYGEPGYHQLVAGAFAGSDGIFGGYQTPAQSADAPGHKFRMGAHINPVALSGLPSSLLDGLGGTLKAPARRTGALPELACEDIAKISKKAARDLEAAEGCR